MADVVLFDLVAFVPPFLDCAVRIADPRRKVPLKSSGSIDSYVGHACLQWWYFDAKKVNLTSVQTSSRNMDRMSYCTLTGRAQTTCRSLIYVLPFFFASTSLIGNYDVSRQDDANLGTIGCGLPVPSNTLNFLSE